MFDCKACAAKDAEIARLWRFLATLKGVEAPLAEETDPEPPLAEERESDAGTGDDDVWANRELERKRLELTGKGARIRPDFPA